MSKLISGKEALIALANGESVQKRSDSWDGDCWLDISKKEPFNLDCFLSGLNRHGETIKFRLKPRTITLNGIEVPAPFDPPENLDNSLLWWVLDTDQECGYSQCRNPKHPSNLLGAWRTEEDIKKVVAALRSVFITI